MRAWMVVLLLMVGSLGQILTAGSTANATRPEARENITFILGTDEDPSAPMFQKAESYFRMESSAHGNRMVTELRSLRQVRDYLAAHPPSNGKPWGTIQWVVHGNGLGQLTLPLEPGGDPLTVKRLNASMDRGEFRPMPDSVLDSKSEIRIHGCAVGRNPELLRLLSVAFGGSDEERPLVRASRFYTCYTTQAHSTVPVRFLSDTRKFVYRMGHQPDQETLRHGLQMQGLELDVPSALQRPSPRFPGDVFSQRAPAHFKWTLVLKYRTECPDLSDPTRLRVWLQEQDRFRNHIAESGLDMDSMEWSAKTITCMHEGVERPAICVEGKGEALYLLKSETSSSIPWDDPRVCASAR